MPFAPAVGSCRMYQLYTAGSRFHRPIPLSTLPLKSRSQDPAIAVARPRNTATTRYWLPSRPWTPPPAQALPPKPFPQDSVVYIWHVRQSPAADGPEHTFSTYTIVIMKHWNTYWYYKHVNFYCLKNSLKTTVEITFLTVIAQVMN